MLKENSSTKTSATKRNTTIQENPVYLCANTNLLHGVEALFSTVWYIPGELHPFPNCVMPLKKTTKIKKTKNADGWGNMEMLWILAVLAVNHYIWRQLHRKR